jgi:hypothetical protein
MSRVSRRACSCESLHMALLRWLGRPGGEETDRVISSRSGLSAAAGYRFPREVIGVAVRWYLRYGLSYRDVEELLAERGIEVDHVTVYRWVQTFTSKFIDCARPARHVTVDRWFVDETYVKGCGPLDLAVSGDRPARSGNRRAGLRAPRRRSCAGVLHPRAELGLVAGRGHHRSGAFVPACARRAAPAARHVLSGIRTRAWRPITADSRRGCGRCAG